MANIPDLIKTLNYCERYNDERHPALQQVRVEIDTELARLYGESLNLRLQRTHKIDHLHHLVDDKRSGYGRTWGLSLDEVTAKAKERHALVHSYEARQIREALEAYESATSALEANKAEQAPLHVEYRRRPWNRAFLVTNTNGHVHRSTECSTCFETTEYAWLTELSGKDEAEIVTAIGSDACTVCYPSAPVETAGPRTVFSEQEKVERKSREQRAAEKDARLQAKIAKGLTADGSEFVVVYDEGTYAEDYYRESQRGQSYRRTEHFKTEVAASQWVVQQIAWGHEARPGNHGSRIPQAIVEIIEAIAAKHGKTPAEVRADIDRKVTAKVKRDGWDGRVDR